MIWKVWRSRSLTGLVSLHKHKSHCLAPSIHAPSFGQHLRYYSASSCATGAVSSTCIPPLFLLFESWYASRNPPLRRDIVLADTGRNAKPSALTRSQALPAKDASDVSALEDGPGHRLIQRGNHDRLSCFFGQNQCYFTCGEQYASCALLYLPCVENVCVR